MLNKKATDDQTLIAFLFEGKKWAFEEIYNRYGKKLLFIAYNQIGAWEEAEELVQEVFLSVWKRRGQIEIRNLNLYLSLAVKNKVYDYIKSQINYRKYQEYLIFQEISETRDTENIVNFKELTSAMEKVLSQLPEKSAEVFRQSRFEDKTVKEIAEQLNLSPKAVEYHITKSLKFLQENLKSYHIN
jgi:RNA polymerase sigma-70 factor (family 1)